MLRDNMPNHKIGFTGSRRTNHEQRPEGIDKIDPTRPLFPFDEILRGKIDAVLVFKQPLFLWKRFISRIKYVGDQQYMRNKLGLEADQIHFVLIQ